MSDSKPAARSALAGRVPRWLSSLSAAGRTFLDKPYASLQLMLFAGVGLLCFGVMMAASTTISASLQDGSHQTMWSQLVREIEFLVVGVPVFWLAVRLSPRAYQRLAYPAILIGVAALLGALVPGVGLQINNARRWIDIGPMQFQPSEFAKLAVLVWGADLLARKQRFGTLSRARHLFVPLVPGFILICGFVMLEPDLGTTLCFVLILLGLLWTIGTPLRYFAVIILMIGAVVAALAVAAPYRLQRLTTFADPFKHATTTGYHTVEGLYALASGGVFGVGLGNSTSKYGFVPNANTDYVFSILGEELGLIGCVVVLALFALFAFAGLRISRRSADPFVRLAAGAATVWITGQAVINIGYVTGLLPVTGIPLPFISAGGTSLLATALVFGMLVSFARHEPEAVAAAKREAAAGHRPRIARLCRLPVPSAYVAPKRTPRISQAPQTPRTPQIPRTPRMSRTPRPGVVPAARLAPRTTTSDTRRVVAQGARQRPASMPLRATGTDSSPPRPAGRARR